MKNSYFLYIIFFFLTSVSCTEVIDIDINAAHPQLVVEAGIGLNEPARVVLTRSISLDDSIQIPFEENAEVVLYVKGGKSEKLFEVTPGIYLSSTITGEVGKTYNLAINTPSEKVTSESTMPLKVSIDSLAVENSIYPGGGPPKGNQPAPFYEIRVKYTDPADRQNFYRFLVYVNGVLIARNSVINDRLFNGNKTEAFLVVYNPELKTGDIISVEMQCIEKPVYEYFNSIGSMRGPNSSSPANPYTNLEGTILGFFSAHTVEKVNYILK